MTISSPHNQTQYQQTIHLTQPEFITLCSFCSKTKGHDDSWNLIDQNSAPTNSSLISHGFCPDCVREHFPSFDWD